MKSDHWVLRKNEADTYGEPIFAPDYSATILAAKMSINLNEHFMYIRFLWWESLKVEYLVVCSMRKHLPYSQGDQIG